MAEERYNPGRNGNKLKVGGTNPGAGRPKKLTTDEVVEQVAADFKAQTGQDLQKAFLATLLKKAMPGGNKGVDLQAAKLVMPYILGNPVQKVEHDLPPVQLVIELPKPEGERKTQME